MVRILLFSIVFSLFLPMTGCNSVWKDNATKAVAAGKSTGDSGYALAKAGYNLWCKKIATECKVKASECKALQDCQAERHMVYEAFKDWFTAIGKMGRAIPYVDKVLKLTGIEDKQ